MTVLSYVQHNDVSDWRDMMQKFQAFASGQGWTIVTNLQSVEWVHQGGGIYAFDPGAEDYIVMTSTGFGSQSLQFRIRVSPNSGDVNDGIVSIGGHKGATGHDTSNATHPNLQTGGGNTLWTFRDQFSFPRATFPSLWIFGNDKFLFMVAQTDTDYVKTICFGSPELIDTTETEGDLFLWQSSSYPTSARWYNKQMQNPFDLATTGVIYYDGDRKNSNLAGVNYTISTLEVVTNRLFTAGYGRLVQRNAYSRVKPLYKQQFFVRHNIDSRWRQLGSSWIYRMDVTDLLIGEQFKLGPTDTYIGFPQGLNTWVKGFAVRIA